MEQNDKDKRDGLIYDVIIKGYDLGFFKATTGTPTVSSNKLRLTSASVSTYLLFKYGDYEFGLNVPTTPSAGEAKTWGLRAPGTDTLGAAYFEITGATFRAVTKDRSTTKTTTLTWSAYENAETLFRIVWEPDRIQFLIAGVVVATHGVNLPEGPLPIRITNGDADNTDLGYIAVRQAASIV